MSNTDQIKKDMAKWAEKVAGTGGSDSYNEGYSKGQASGRNSGNKK